MNVRNLILLVPVLAGALALAGCGGGGGGGGLPDPSYRVVNLSPDTTVDVAIDGATKESGISYLATTTSFRSISQNSYDVNLRETGTNVDLTSDAYTFVKDGDYVITAVGLKNFGDEPLKRLRTSVFRFDRKTPNGTKARVIAFNGYVRATGSQTPAVQFRGPGDSPQFTFDTIAFGNGSTRDLDAGPQTIVVRPEGGEATLVQATVTLDAGKIYLAAFTGVEGGTGDQLPAIRFIELKARS